jgi:hypothetical protein
MGSRLVRSLLGVTLGAAALYAAPNAFADLIGGDLRNDVASNVQSSVTYTRANLPVDDVSYWWIEPRDGDVINGCNADAEHPVTVTLTATPGPQLSQAATQHTSCGVPTPRPDGSGFATPANAVPVQYRLPATMPLGRSTIRGAGSGGQTTADGRTGTFTTRTMNININPRPASDLQARASASRVRLDWAASPDHADITAYQVRRRTGDGTYGDWTAPLGESTGTRYEDDSVQRRTTYCYQVRAVLRQEMGGGAVETFPSSQTVEQCVTTHGNLVLSSGENRIEIDPREHLSVRERLAILAQVMRWMRTTRYVDVTLPNGDSFRITKDGVSPLLARI